MGAAWCVLGLIEVRVYGASPVADAVVHPILGLSLACAVAGVFGALLAFRRDPGERSLRRGPNARGTAVALAWSSGAAGALAFVPRLLGGLAGQLVLIVLALSLSGLSISAIPTVAVLAGRSPARRQTSPRALAVLVGGTELLLFVYAAGLTLLPRTPFVGNYVAALIIVLPIAIPASAFFYLQFLWRVLCCVRVALEAQGRAPADRRPAG
jgi:hypothetical protein